MNEQNVMSHTSKLKDAAANEWATYDLDYYLTISFSEEAYLKYKLKHPHNLMAFTKQRLERANYYGPYVIAIHDKKSDYWHPHLLLKDNGAASGKGSINEIRRSFFSVGGNLDHKNNGPIRGMGAFFYCANRAYESGPDSQYWDARRAYVRRPRPHSRGSKMTQPVAPQ